MIVHVHATYLLYVNEIAKKCCFVVKRYTVREAEIGRHAVRKGVSPSWKWILVHVLSLSGKGFQIKYIIIKVRKTTFCLKHSFCKKYLPPLLHWLGSALHSSFMWMKVFMLKENRCKCKWKPTTKYATKCICLVSFLHKHTKYLELQACKKLAHGGVKAFDDYICTSVNVKKWIHWTTFLIGHFI